MGSLIKLKESIDQQLKLNSRLNLYYEGLNTNRFFTSELKIVLSELKEELIEVNKKGNAAIWINYLVESVLNIFYKANQYIDVRKDFAEDLKQVYKQLWDDILNGYRNGDINYDKLQQVHLQRLKNWLYSSNPFTKKLNSSSNRSVIDVISSMYSPEIQIKILDIDISKLKEPILDIGCGENAELVEFLRGHGLKAYGLDRTIANKREYLVSSNWIEFNYGIRKWGSIVSNNAFSLHFNHHNDRIDGDYNSYAHQYLEILNSLKTGGIFYYAPSLLSIETFLPEGIFKIDRKNISVDLFSTRIQRLM